MMLWHNQQSEYSILNAKGADLFFWRGLGWEQIPFVCYTMLKLAHN